MMNQKLSIPVVVAIIVVAVLAIAASVTYYRKSTGADVADQMHAAMAKSKPGQSPFTQEQMQQMRSGGKPAAEAPH